MPFSQFLFLYAAHFILGYFMYFCVSLLYVFCIFCVFKNWFLKWYFLSNLSWNMGKILISMYLSYYQILLLDLVVNFLAKYLSSFSKLWYMKRIIYLFKVWNNISFKSAGVFEDYFQLFFFCLNSGGNSYFSKKLPIFLKFPSYLQRG